MVREVDALLRVEEELEGLRIELGGAWLGYLRDDGCIGSVAVGEDRLLGLVFEGILDLLEAAIDRERRVVAFVA